MTKTLLGALAVLGLAAPPSHATHVTADCELHSVQQDDLTGQTYEGVLSGYAAGAVNEAVTIRCYVEDGNGSTVATTPTGAGTTAAVTVARATWLAGDRARLCTEVTHSHGSSVTCR